MNVNQRSSLQTPPAADGVERADWLAHCRAQVEARQAAEESARQAELELAATEPTIRKLRRSVTEKLFEAGRLSALQIRAASEICRCWEAICTGLFAKAMRLDKQPRGAPAEDWSPSLRVAYSARYAPWRDEAALVTLRHRYSLADLVFSIVVDNHGVYQVGKRLGMDERTVLRHLQFSLYRYVEQADWLDDKGRAEALALVAHRAAAPQPKQRKARPETPPDHVRGTAWKAPSYTPEQLAGARAKLIA
ncbi:hypothetical protein [Limobrevibacterium gyesilva]|uniref:Uncharacterized protein n=1 Tax=Limobrevibacterium gyesilva TaxID=2991712 RepID=A0AA41YVN2_9PROT|nr:hypothetical protein [Limobrevibacterium gyesilva]MCW3477353.1 hypothetical protein [Limobrevibacterium gyesilva]